MLTDNEKFIISTLVIKRSQNFQYTPEQKIELLKMYVTFLPDVRDKTLFWIEMGKEQGQYVKMLTDFKERKESDFDGNVSDMTPKEKYIQYITEMMCTLNLPIDVHFCFKEIMRKLLYGKDDIELVTEIKEYTNVVIAWLKVMRKHKF